MTNYISQKSVIQFFQKLNSNNDIDYILIRNIANELPSRLISGKDIDLLVKYSQKTKIHTFLKKNGFKKIKHPHRNNIYLYGIPKFEFFTNKEGLIIDLNYNLVCRSLDKGQWLPLDQLIQKSAWENKINAFCGSNLEYWSLSYEDSFLTLIVRCIFDKREFNENYITEIEWYIQKINLSQVKQKLELIFFKFSDDLLKLISTREYSKVIPNYLAFKNY